MTEGIIVALISGIFMVIGISLKLIMDRKKAKESEGEIPQLPYHSVFKIMDSLIIKADTFRVNDPGKQKALRYVLKNALIIFKDEMMQLAEKIEECERVNCSQDQKSSHMINQNSDAVNNSFKRVGMLSSQVNLPGSDLEVIRLIMEKLMERISIKIETLNKGISDIAMVEAISDCKMKQYLGFILWGAVVSTVYIDLQSVSDEINGDLDGMIFMGETIGY